MLLLETTQRGGTTNSEDQVGRTQSVPVPRSPRVLSWIIYQDSSVIQRQQAQTFISETEDSCTPKQRGGQRSIYSSRQQEAPTRGHDAQRKAPQDIEAPCTNARSGCRSRLLPASPFCLTHPPSLLAWSRSGTPRASARAATQKIARALPSWKNRHFCRRGVATAHVHRRRHRQRRPRRRLRRWSPMAALLCAPPSDGDCLRHTDIIPSPPLTPPPPPPPRSANAP